MVGGIDMSDEKIISIESRVQQKVGLDSSDMDGEIVMMNMETGKYYCFNSVGSKIWKLIDEKQSVKDIVSKLISEFEVEPEVCESEVIKFLNGILNEELISVD